MSILLAAHGWHNKQATLKSVAILQWTFHLAPLGGIANYGSEWQNGDKARLKAYAFRDCIKDTEHMGDSNNPLTYKSW